MQMIKEYKMLNRNMTTPVLFHSSISNPENTTTICGDEKYIIKKLINLKTHDLPLERIKHD